MRLDSALRDGVRYRRMVCGAAPHIREVSGLLLKQMRYFIAVADCGSFTLAAEQCYLSQSAISQQIQALERELGVELLHRANRKFTLTAAGEHFYARGKAILGQVDDLLRETRRLGADDELRLRIGYPRSYSGLELRRAVAEEAQRLGSAGRILLRPSGTEALIRVMVEAKTEEMAQSYAEKLVNVVKSLKIV